MHVSSELKRIIIALHCQRQKSTSKKTAADSQLTVLQA